MARRAGADLRDLALDDPTLADGWWAVEWDAASWPCRWTNGDALLPVSGPCLLEVELGDQMLYPLEHRQEPARRVA